MLITFHFTSFAATKVLVFGDSISAAHGLNTEQGWVYLLQQKLKTEHIDATVINASISGETTVGGLNRMATILAETQPDILILELGGNDALRGFPIDIIEQNLSKMTDMAQKENIKVLLAGMRIPPNYGKQYTEKFHQMYLNLAKRYKVAIVPFLLEGIGDNPELMQTDGIHPNANAQEKILAHVWPKLVKMLDCAHC